MPVVLRFSVTSVITINTSYRRLLVLGRVTLLERMSIVSVRATGVRSTLYDYPPGEGEGVSKGSIRG